jgi:hypothetical protein
MIEIIVIIISLKRNNSDKCGSSDNDDNDYDIFDTKK